MVLKTTKKRNISDIPFPPSTMETIDSALHKFINETLDVNCMTPSGFIKVPVVWSGAERAYQSKNLKVRDAEGALKLPLMTIERTNVTKDPSRKGTVYANIPPTDKVRGGSISVSRRIKQDKTSNFQNAKTKRKRGQLNFPGVEDKTVYQTLTIPLPVYVTVQYEITIRTEYQSQMNEAITPFITRPGGINYVILEEGRLRYEAFIQADFSQSNNISNFSNEERKFETKVNIEVLGWLTGEDKNRLQPNISVQESVVEIKIPRERVALADDLDPANGRMYGLAGLKRKSRFKKADDAVSTFGPVKVPGSVDSASSATVGARGPKGDQGPAGVGISTVQLVDFELIVTLTDGTQTNLGNIRGAAGETPNLDVISGSTATYHTFDGDKGVFNDLDVLGTTNFTGDVTVQGNLIGGSPLKVSSSLAIIGDGGSTIAVLGSSSLGNNVLSASLAAIGEITASSNIKFTGLQSAAAVSTKYLALDANNNIVLTSSSPVVNLFVSGSSAEFHLISGSNAKLNFLDSDRGSINDFDFTSFSGSTGVVHNLSSSTATLNFLDSDRAVMNDLTGSGNLTFTGLSSGTAVTGKHLALDANNKVILTTGGGLSAANYLANTQFQENPNGNRTTFTVAVAFVNGTQQVYRNGLYMTPGVGNDYTVTNTTTIEFTEAPETGENLRITYIRS